MNYELAKALKDAGFSQQLVSQPNLGKGYYLGGAYHPTLSELIEACGEGFHYLSDTSGFKDLDGVTQKWVAHSRDHCRMGLGSTPEEAVARLWLALQVDNPSTSPIR